MGLFKKAAIFTDIHFGLRNDSTIHNEDCLEFIEWFAAQTVAQGCDTIIFGGDWYHNRIRTENRTAHYSRIGIEILDGLKLPIFWIIGNHDIYFRDSRDVISLYLSKHRNIHVIDTITKIDDVVFSPWLVGEEHQDLINRQATYCWGHFQLESFLLNQSIESHYDGGLHSDDFASFDAVYSGHFHKRQVRKNKHGIPITYIGNTFGHDFNDVGDAERGMTILKWGEVLPEYKAWPDAPTYHRFDISNFMQLIGRGEKPYGPRASIELVDDIGLPDTEIAELKGLVGEARQIRIRKTKTDPVNQQVSDITKYASLDEMVETKLATLNYDGRYDPSLLVKLYRSV